MDNLTKAELLELKQLLNTLSKRFNLSRKEDRRLKFIMANEFYYSKEDVKNYLELGGNFSIIKEAHDLMDKLHIIDSERESMWKAHKAKIRSYKTDYSLRPIQSRRDNKDIRVGSGYGSGNSIRYPRKGHKNAWKKFYKLFPHKHPDYDKEKTIIEIKKDFFKEFSESKKNIK